MTMVLSRTEYSGSAERSRPHIDTRPERPRLVLHDMTDEIARADQRRRVSRRDRSSAAEGYAITIAVAAVMVFVLCSAAASVWHTAARSIGTESASAVPVVTVTVGPGDTLWQYAAKYGDPNVYILDRVETIARANHVSSQTPLTAGQTLRIPVQNPTIAARLAKGSKVAAAIAD